MCEQKDAILPYAAGLFDGEGWMSIVKQHDPRRLPYPRRHVLKVFVASGSCSAIVWLKKTFGGTVYLSKPKRQGQHVVWVWVIQQKMAGQFLKDVLPFLRIKTEQARVAVEFQTRLSNSGRRRMTLDEFLIRDRYKTRISSFARKGPIREGVL